MRDVERGMMRDINDSTKWTVSCYAARAQIKGKLSPTLTQASQQSSTHTPFVVCSSCRAAYLPPTTTTAGPLIQPSPLPILTPASLPLLACTTYRDFSAFFFFLLRYNAVAPPRTITAAAAAKRGNCFLERLEEDMTIDGRRRLPQLLSVLLLCPVPVCACVVCRWWMRRSGVCGTRRWASVRRERG